MPGNHLLYAVVNTAGDIYVCFREHQSNPMNEPGFGPDWPLYWRLDNSYVGLYGVWVGPLISVHYRPPAVVTTLQRQRDDETVWLGKKHRWRRFLTETPAFFSPPKLLNVSTRRKFPSTRTPDVLPTRRSQRARGFMLGQQFQFFQSPRELRRAPYRQPISDKPPRLDRAWMMAPAFFFDSYVRVRGRSPWMGMTDKASVDYIEMTAGARDRCVALLYDAGGDGGIPKIGDKTITPERSHFVAGV